ncbi:MAG: hypothetical protein IPL47_04610 [Phyllobacteriaceae bacterium]|nr:hypothetical protein [Phyllobacteriaceae bacterium]
MPRRFAGEIAGGLTDLSAAENKPERRIAATLLEVYSPIRESFTGEVIAVVEFYEKADALEEVLRRAMVQSWIAVVAITALIGAGLFGIVDAGSRTIERQRRTLVDRVDELQRLSGENEKLRQRVARLGARVRNRRGASAPVERRSARRPGPTRRLRRASARFAQTHR